MTDTDNWPTYAEELGRKTLDVLGRWMKAHEVGKISNREFFILLDGLYNATVGLAPMEVIDIISAAHEELRANAAARKSNAS